MVVAGGVAYGEDTDKQKKTDAHEKWVKGPTAVPLVWEEEEVVEWIQELIRRDR